MSATLLDHSTPKARKSHRCACCLKDIDAGTEYVRQRIVDSHELWVFKAHPCCYSTLMDYCSYYAIEGDEGMPDWGDVQQWVAEGNMDPSVSYPQATDEDDDDRPEDEGPSDDSWYQSSLEQAAGPPRNKVQR